MHLPVPHPHQNRFSASVCMAEAECRSLELSLNLQKESIHAFFHCHYISTYCTLAEISTLLKAFHRRDKRIRSQGVLAVSQSENGEGTQKQRLSSLRPTPCQGMRSLSGKRNAPNHGS